MGSRGRTRRGLLLLALAGLAVFAASALAAQVLYVLDQNFAPGQARSNGAYSDIYANRMANIGAHPQGVYQRYSNGSTTRRKTDFAAIVEVVVAPGSAIYTQAWCYNPSGPAGPTVPASQCRLTNTT